MIEGEDIRLMYAGPTPDSHELILVAMRGDGGQEDKDLKGGVVDKIVELQETSEISDVRARTPTTAVPAMWEEWDM